MDGGNDTPEPSRRGRPRAAGMDEAIRQAGWAVLTRMGYEGLTFEAVAELAGCSRPALYRRYASKSDLIFDMINSRLVEDIEPDITWPDDPREALLEHMHAMVRFMEPATRDVSLALSQARKRDLRIAAASDRAYHNGARHYADALSKASGGKAPRDFCELLAESLIGTVMYRLVMSNGEITEAELIELVDQAIRSAKAGPGPAWPTKGA